MDFGVNALVGWIIDEDSVESNLIKRGDITYISAKLLADGIDARLRAGEHGEFYLTMVRAVSLTLPKEQVWTDTGAQHMKAELGKDFGYAL